jgi:tripartite-type tricarboxylate transporter receptor subunit TctC
MKMHALIAVSLFALGSGIGLAQAQSFPTRTVTMVVPFGAGSGTDNMARAVADKLGRELKQPVVVENRPGGAAQIGVTHVVNSDPDGYTHLFLGGGSMNKVFVKDLQIDLLKDLTPIVQLGRGGMTLFVSTSLPVNNLQEFVEYVKKNPGKLNYGGSAVTQMLSMELLKARAGIKKEDIVYIPYKGGAQSLQGIMSGEIQASVESGITFDPAMKAGKAKPIAHGDLTRSPALPDVPTVAEGGIPGVTFPFTFGAWAPAKTPKDAVMRLNAAYNAVLKDPDVAALIRKANGTVVGGAPEVHAQAIRDEFNNWETAAKAANYKPE